MAQFFDYKTYEAGYDDGYHGKSKSNMAGHSTEYLAGYQAGVQDKASGKASGSSEIELMQDLLKRLKKENVATMKKQLQELLEKKPTGFVNEVAKRLEEKRAAQVEATKKSLYKEGVSKKKS